MATALPARVQQVSQVAEQAYQRLDQALGMLEKRLYAAERHVEVVGRVTKRYRKYGQRDSPMKRLWRIFVADKSPAKARQSGDRSGRSGKSWLSGVQSPSAPTATTTNSGARDVVPGLATGAKPEISMPTRVSLPFRDLPPASPTSGVRLFRWSEVLGASEERREEAESEQQGTRAQASSGEQDLQADGATAPVEMPDIEHILQNAPPAPALASEEEQAAPPTPQRASSERRADADTRAIFEQTPRRNVDAALAFLESRRRQASGVEGGRVNMEATAELVDTGVAPHADKIVRQPAFLAAGKGRSRR